MQRGPERKARQPDKKNAHPKKNKSQTHYSHKTIQVAQLWQRDRASSAISRKRG